MAQPEGFVHAKYPHKVCKLKRSIYGLKQASRSWNLYFQEKVKEFGFSRSKDESCVYVKASGSNVARCKNLAREMFCYKDLGNAISREPGESHWTTVKNILKYLRRNKDVLLVYGGNDKLRVTGYTDASFQTDRDDSRSQSGRVFLLSGEAVTWECSKQDTVADSTCESEYIAASEVVKEVVWFKIFIGAVALTKEPKDHGKSKHIETKYHFVRHKVEETQIVVSRVPTEENLLYPFTKALTRPKHKYHTEAISSLYDISQRICDESLCWRNFRTLPASSEEKIHRVLLYDSVMLWCAPTLTVTGSSTGYVQFVVD
ncbi:hypothetical protein OSB04_031711 [Centaurea solstitialis]|uniref:Reverse transcriptase Ty1/copia-type domain-containing protein n=1 Tax=Centaurea solstitialis TaxID=347529 RepID=A0AA38SAX3_9ASTR|nr:hypothetical protein OSB04_031711 [Centaurea solstitialis]